MNKQELFEVFQELIIEYNKINKISEQKKQQKIEIVEKIEDILVKFLQKNPLDTDAWFKLSLVFFKKSDIQGSIECMEKILNYDPKNTYAFLLFVWFHDYWPFIHDALFERLAVFSIKDKKIMSLIEYLKADYYSTNKNETMEELSLKKSIEFCDEYVWNYNNLARLYIYQDRYNEAYPLVLKALSNIKRVSDPEQDFYNFLDLDELIHEFLTGIWINNAQYEHIVSLLENFCVTKNFDVYLQN